MAMDLTGIAVDDQTTFALSDMFENWRYKLEVLDDASSPLSLSGVALTNYNLTYAGPIVADLNVTLSDSTGILQVTPFLHDGDPLSTYRHSGFVTFTNLPAATAFIRITSGSLDQQVSEGVHFYLAKEVPEPGTVAQALTAIVALALWTRRAHLARHGVAAPAR